MKTDRLALLLSAGVTLGFLVSGCHPRPENLSAIPGRSGPPPQLQPMPPILPAAPPEGAQSALIPLTENGHSNWIENADVFKADSIHFAFDSAVVRNSDQSKIAAVAGYLKSNPQSAVRVEGNCDERGTEEYNRALGERRALAARAILVGMGIDPTRADTISYGEDRPLDPGHNEKAWAKNRRDDFILLTPPK